MWEAVVSLLYPRRCPVCQEAVLPRNALVCQNGCEKRFHVIEEPRCKCCGKPLEQPRQEYCYDCRKTPHTFQYGYAMWLYDSTMARSIAAFKYKDRREYGEYYGSCMAKKYGKWLCSLECPVLVPVPVHKRRYRKRGYNQAQVLSEVISRKTGIPVAADWLIRIKNTAPQKELDDQERLKNLLQAFGVREEKTSFYIRKYRSVILIDDIYTTGSTLESCARILKQQGVHHIYFLCMSIGQGM
ncbi:MAG: ComF family protein [Clostridiales bacterium]|nr:ComF family protein [Clostridiales bacterium]